MSRRLTVQTDELSRAARDGMMIGDLRPFAEWLRAQGDLNALMLAEAMEAGSLTLQMKKGERLATERLMAGRFIVEQERRGRARKQALEDARREFPGSVKSDRVAERCKEDWVNAGGEDMLAALTFLFGQGSRAE